MRRNPIAPKTVYNFTSLTRMKFRSPGKTSSSQIKSPSVLTKLKSLSWLSGSKIKQSQKQSTIQHEVNLESSRRANPFPSPIQFVKKLTNQHFLIGNQFRVDVISLGSVVEDFIDTEYIWSLNFKKSIINVAVDAKKYFIAFLVGYEVQIFQYNLRRSKQPPTLLTTIKSSGQVKFIQFAKQSNLALFYQNSFQIYVFDQNTKLANLKCNKKYDKPEESKIFQVPQAFEGVINVFFQKDRQDGNKFELWNLEVKLQKDQIAIAPVLKIYEISTGLKQKIVLSNYSREIFCMNLGTQISAVKKGYIIDTANSNTDSEGAVLRYLGNDKLIHITQHKIQLYRFSINMALNPPRIVLESIDSIYSKMNDQNYIFVQVLQMLSQNMVVFYQISQAKNNSLSGQIKYAFCVTQKVKFQDKIRQILPSAEELEGYKANEEKKISDKDYEIIDERCDMAMKMGLTRKQIYLRLWNNSTKCDVVDYQFLLDTLSYEAIRAQIENKLKKKSMVLRQVIKIQQGCLDMLHKGAFSFECTSQTLKNFLISHFLLRKLRLYQMFYLLEKADNKTRKSRIVSSQNQKEDSQTVMINIKDYISYSKCDLKAVLLELIRDFCYNQKDTILKIRTLVRLFRFSFRPIYSGLLEDIIKEAGTHLLQLLEAIPQILPYQHTFLQQPTDATLYEGIWGRIIPEQWEANLYAGGITTIDNKEVVQQMVKSVWAKRFFLTLHDLLPYSKSQILQIHEKNKAEQTFYNFIEKVFQNISDRAILEDLMKFVETTYTRLPRHLIGHIFLYRALYDYLNKQKALKPKIQKGQFNQFLKLKDFEICKMIFDLQKRKKNCILRDVKQGIYSSPEFISGNDIFNLSLLNFFSSELSEISDIKYLLNRLNNQKYEFHSQNQGMYEVIVKGMQAKLYLGSDHDIPIDQVYIYISNIHIEEDSQIKKDLKYLNIVNKYSQKFRKIKLNMSVFQIIREVQKVLSIVINYEVESAKITQKTGIQDIQKQSLRILQEVETLRNDIYFESNMKKELVLFIYITRILQSQHFVEKVKLLLQSPLLQQQYQVDEIFIENVTLYMYKKKFSEDKIYCHNQSYIKALLTLLNENNQTRQFISYELELGVTLSCNGNLLEYPLGGSNAILSTVELETAINFLPGQKIKCINFERIYQISLKMQQISSDGEISSISIYQIYEIVILRFIECKLIKDSIPFIRKIIEIDPNSTYNFIYPVLIIKKFSIELCDQNKAALLMILTYQYQHPTQLLDIVEKLLTTKCTSLEQKLILKGQLKRIQSDRQSFNMKSPVLNPDYVSAAVTQKEKTSLAIILRKCLARILLIKDQFSRNPEYAIIYTILVNNPYAISKYLYCARYQSNFKGVRCFFSHLIKEEVFNRTAILELGKRIFKILHQGLSQTVYIQNIITKYSQTDLSINMDIKKIIPLTNLSIVLSKSVQRFKNKIKQDSKRKDKRSDEAMPELKRQKIKAKLAAETPEIQEILNDYPFQDSDNQMAGIEPKLKRIQTNQSTNVQFDSGFERQLLISRNEKVLGIYLSQEFGTKEKQMFYSKKFEQLQIRNSVLKLKDKKKQIEQQYSMRLSTTQKSRLSRLQSSDIIQSPRIAINTPLKHTMSIDLAQSIRAQDFQVLQKSEDKLPIIELIPQESEQSSINSNLILDKIRKSSKGENYDIEAISETNFDEFQFKQFIIKLYESDKFSVTQSLGIIRKINQKPQIIAINSDYLDIYWKMDHFQKKFNLDINLKKMFPIEGIFLQSKNPNQLFSFVKHRTTQLLTQNNVYKITKVMSLVFKNNDIQQELNIQFLKKFLKQFEASAEILDSKQVLMQKQKIKAFTQKISIHQLNAKDEDIINSIQKGDLKTFIIESIVEAMKKRKNEQMAQSFKQKWKG